MRRTVIVAIWAAIAINVAVTVIALREHVPVYAANVSAIVICLFALWLLRHARRTLEAAERDEPDAS
jgi:hypothetical protein